MNSTNHWSSNSNFFIIELLPTTSFLSPTFSSNPFASNQPPLSTSQNHSLNPSSSISPNVSYDPYASLHPGFHKYTQPSLPPPSHANPLTPSTSAYTFINLLLNLVHLSFIWLFLFLSLHSPIPDPIIHEHVRRYALKVETLVKKGLYNELNFKCNEVSIRGFPNKIKWKPSFLFTLLSIWLTVNILLLKKLKLKNFHLKLSHFWISFCKTLHYRKQIWIAQPFLLIWHLPLQQTIKTSSLGLLVYSSSTIAKTTLHLLN